MDFSKFMEWTATWQNALALVFAITAAIWLTYDPNGSSTVADFLLVMVIGLCVARVLIALGEALWRRFSHQPPNRP